MFGPRSLYLFSLLFFYSVFGESKNVRKSEVTEDFKKDNSRTDAEQDPFTSVTLTSQAGDPQSNLFSTCIAKSQTIEAKFVSIEVVPGSEYIRYVPDSFQLSFPISWKSVSGSYPSILDCAEAAHDGGWSMFKYDGTMCEVLNTTYSLNDVPNCEEEDSDAVFILSTAVEDCPMPRFFVGLDSSENVVCGLVNEDQMTHDEAKNFCLEVYPDNELTLYVNAHSPLSLTTTTNRFTELGYTKTNLWVDAAEAGDTNTGWYGDFSDSDWHDGQFPPLAAADAPKQSAYLDKDSQFKLRVSDTSYKAGVLCISTAVPSTEGG